MLVLVAGSAAAELDDLAPYEIRPGDVVDVQVWREPDLSGPHRIDESGRLHHVLVGIVDAQNLTTEELGAELKQRLEKDYLREARVLATVTTSISRKAWILGAVSRPGNYPVAEGTRLLDLVFAAGGVSEASTGRAEFYRGSERIPVDLAALLSGDLKTNRSVAVGDVLVVEASDSSSASSAPADRVRVVGEVRRPGSYPLSEAPTALDAVLAAGGFTEYAAANRARLVRGSDQERSEEKLRLLDIVRGREDSRNIELRDGDLIVVPESLF